MLIYNGQIIAGGGTIVLPMTRAEYEANKAILDSADVWVDLTDEPDAIATADQVAFWVGQTQKSVGYIGDIATKALAKVEPTDTALYLHEVGEYFINKDGDACKVDIQIPVNGTITLGTNCHVLSKGVANDITSNLAYSTESSAFIPVTGVSISSNCAKFGLVKTVSIDFSYSNAPTTFTSIATVKDGYKPLSSISLYVPSRSGTGGIDLNISSGGNVTYRASGSTTTGRILTVVTYV